jgi:hypothetical protein
VHISHCYCLFPSHFSNRVDYYGMTNGIFPSNLKIQIGSEDSVEIIHLDKVNARELTTFGLRPEGHGQCVKSYEVILGAVRRIQIGGLY